MRFRRAISWCVLALSAAASAQSPTQEQVQAWFDAEWKAADRFPDFGDHAMHWVVENHFVPSPEELARLRAEVVGKPEHPDRQSLDRYEARLRGLPTLRRSTLWCRDRDHWRHNMDGEDPRAIPWDTVLTPRHGWHLTKYSLQVADSGDGYGPQFDLPNQVRSLWPEVGQLLTGGLTLGNSFFARLVPQPATVDQFGWQVVAHRVGRNTGTVAYEVVFEGIWDPVAARGFVTSMAQYSPAPERALVELRLTKDWQYEPTLERWIAHRAELYSKDTKLDRVLRFDGMTIGDRGRFEAVTAIPRHDRDEPVRGQLTFTRLMDYSDGSITEQTPQGTVTSRLLK